MVNIVEIKIDKDFTKGQSCGADGFQVANLYGYDEDGKEYDFEKNIDQGQHYYNENEVLDDLINAVHGYDFSKCEISE